MDIIRPSLDKDLIHKILDIKPKYITTPAFLNMLLEEAYNARCEKKKNMSPYIHTMIEAFDEVDKQRELEKKEEKEKINKKEKQEKIVPEDLKIIEQLILEFWKTKKGSKTIEAWKRQITEYRKFIEKYGVETLKDQLDAGILAGTWKGCTIKNYEEQQQRINRFNKEPEQSIMHPNQKVAEFDEYGRLI